MTRQEAKNLNSDVDKALSAIGLKYGVNLSVSSLRYNDVDVKISVKGVVMAKNGKDPAKDRAADMGALELCFLGSVAGEKFAAEDLLGNKLLIRGKKYSFVDFNRKAKQYPFILENETGTKYKFTSLAVLDAIKASRAVK